MHKHSQSGNALWFILIAVVLLGGLTILMTRSSSTSDDSGDYERNRIHASEMMRYANSMSTAVQNLISRGCSESQISFWYDSNGDDTENGSDLYYNAAAPNDNRCHVFAPEGGALVYAPPKAAWLNATGAKIDFVAAEQCIAHVGTGDTTCDNANTDLMYQIIAIKPELCMAINNMVGIDNPGGAPPVEAHGSARFTGAYTANITAATALITSAQLNGKDTGCFTDNGGTYDGQHIFYHVIYAR